MVQLKSKVGITTLCLMLAACGDSFNSGDRINGNSNLNNGSNTLTLDLKGLEQMDGQHYEGWVRTSGGVVSTGRFNVDANGLVYNVDASGRALSIAGTNKLAEFENSVSASAADAFILTIEPDNDTDAAPSGIRYLEGDFNRSGSALATVSTNFRRSAGTYILATPTNGPATHNQGIWYLEAGAPTLEIPVLQEGWAYEGWILNRETGEVVSTGTFMEASGADSDGAGATAGALGAPPFPGQDFINPALVLNDGIHTAVITVEPYPDFDPAPFTLKILAADIPLDAAVTTSMGLENIANEDTVYLEARIQN